MARRLIRAAAAVLVVCVGRSGAGNLRAEVRLQTGVVGPGSVAAGRAHTVVATPTGRVFAWGAGGRGQIGDGTLIDRWTPTRVEGLDAVVSVAAGAAHSVAVTKSGDVYAWGANTFGRLGDGTTKRRSRPVRVRGLANVVMVAAGRAHTLALRTDGRVFAWGRNTVQKNKRKMASILVPTQVSGLADIVAIAAGDAHSLAVTRDGRLFAWGSNEFGMLGDGTTKDRPQPVLVALADVVAVAAGTTHSLAQLRTGEVYSWGRGVNGELGTGSTRVSSAPAIVQGVQAVAVAAGRHYSAAILRDGQVAAWGANGSGQLGDGTTTRRLRPVVVQGLESVSVLALGNGHAVAVTATGSVQTWGEGASGRLGNGSESDQASVSEVTSDDPDWWPRDQEEPGPPDPPSIIPITGTYPVAQTVTLSAAQPGDIVRFTVNGTDPNDASTVYTSPFVIAASSTVVARSYSSKGAASAVRAETYTIDTTPPSIVAMTSPLLHDGWMTEPVTITFECADDLGVAACSGPVTITQDGFAQQIVGTAVDRAGNRATTSVSVSVDIHPPVLTINTPGDAAEIGNDEVLVTGSAFDPGTGVSEVRCNGEAAQFVDGAVTCAVRLQPGRNEIILHARDAIGHNSSTAISVTRVGESTTLSLAPATRRMVLNEVARLALRDQFGAVVAGAAWSTSDQEVIALSESDPPELTAVGVGTATVSATKDGIVATSEVTVATGMAAGDVRWTLPPLAGASAKRPIFTNRVNASVPDMFAIDVANPVETTLRALTADGEVLWQQHAPGIPLMGDSFGGVLVGAPYEADYPGSDFRALLHVGGGSVRPWRYESPGMISNPAQSREGLIYAIELIFSGLSPTGNEIWDKHVTIVDGATGRLIRRTPLAREVNEFISAWDGLVLDTTPKTYCKSYRNEAAPTTVGPVVGADGRGYVIVRRYAIQKRADCLEPRGRRAERTISMGVDLVILSPAAAPEVINLHSTSCEAAMGTTMPCDLPIRLYQLMPDGIGGTLATWERGTHMVGPAVFVQKSISRVGADSAVSERPVGPQFWLELVGQAGIAYAFDGDWRAFDVTTGATKWASPLPGLALLGARPDGGLALLDMNFGSDNGTLKMTDAAGTVTTTQPFGLSWTAVHEFGDWIGLRSGELTAVVGEFSDATRFGARGGNRAGQLTVRRPGVGIFAKTHLALQLPGDLLRFRHVSIRVVPEDQALWLNERNAELPGVDEFGNRFFTLGAGPDGADTTVQCGGTLKSDLNRSNDVGTPPWDPLEKLAYHAANENSIINELLSLDAAYDDDLLYACRPEDNPGFYNSNSFANGLIRAARLSGARLPDRVPALFPGWKTPVPALKFR